MIGSGQKGSKENELSESEQVDKKVKKALITSFLSVQQKLERQTNFDCSLSGSTLVGVYQRENQIFFSNCGDSRAVLIGEAVDPTN